MVTINHHNGGIYPPYIPVWWIIYTPILVVYVAPVLSTKYGACWEHELDTFACNVGGVHSLHAKSTIRYNIERKRFQHVFFVKLLRLIIESAAANKGG